MQGERALSISGQRGLQSLMQLEGGLAGLASLDVSVARNLTSLDGLQVDQHLLTGFC